VPLLVVLLTVRLHAPQSHAAQATHPKAAVQTNHVLLSARSHAALSKHSLSIESSSAHTLKEGLGVFLSFAYQGGEVCSSTGIHDQTDNKYS